PDELANEILGLLAPYGVTPTGEGEGGVFLIPLSRLNSIVAIAFDPIMFTEIERWLKLLDIPPEESAGRQTFVYPVENAKAADLAAVLNELFGGGPGGGGGGGLGRVPGGAPAGIGLFGAGGVGGGGGRGGFGGGGGGGGRRTRAAAGPATHLQAGGAHRRGRRHQLARRPGDQARLPADPRRGEASRRRAAAGDARGHDRRDHAHQGSLLRHPLRAGRREPTRHATRKG